jgi:HK97 family phage portal protein
MSRFIDFISDIFVPGKTYRVNQKLRDEDESPPDPLSLGLSIFAADVAQNLICGLISKTEFKTYSKNKEIRDVEWGLWNLSPNPNQSAADFKSAIIRKMLNNSECLVVDLGGSFYIADSFQISNDVINQVTFSNVTLAGLNGSTITLQKTFQMSDVLYFRWTDTKASTYIREIEAGYDKLVSAAMRKYKRSNGRKGVARIDKTASGSEEEKKKLEELFQKGFKSYFNDENGLVVLPRGVDYSELQKPDGSSSMNEVSNLQNLTREALSRAAQAYRIPPAILLGEMADTSSAFEQLLSCCIDPLIKAIETEILRKRYGVKALNDGTYLKIDTSCIEHVDIFKVAVQADKALADGIVCIDEIRQKVGLPPLDTGWSTKHWMTKNYSDIESVGEEGG